MKTLTKRFDHFDRFDPAMNQWLGAHSVTLLRLGLGVVFLGFGALKFFSGISPLEDPATHTTGVLTSGVLQEHSAMTFVAVLECIMGLCFITGRFLRFGVWLMAAQMIGPMSPLVIFPGALFAGPFHGPTLATQYDVKDIMLVAVGMVIVPAWTEARILAVYRTCRSSLAKRLPDVQRSLEPVFN